MTNKERPLIGVDVDGVLYCWDRTARYMLRQKMIREGRAVPIELTRPSTGWHMIQNTVREEDWEWLWSEGVEQGLFRHGDVMSGAIFGVQALHEFADLMIITSRPEQGVHDTMAWLNLHLSHVPLSGINILSHGQPKSAVRPTPDLLIDDGLHNMEDWTRNTNSRFILFNQPWNKAGDVYRPAGNRGIGWKDTVGKAKAMLAERRSRGPVPYVGESLGWDEEMREVL